MLSRRARAGASSYVLSPAATVIGSRLSPQCTGFHLERLPALQAPQAAVSNVAACWVDSPGHITAVAGFRVESWPTDLRSFIHASRDNSCHTKPTVVHICWRTRICTITKAEGYCSQCSGTFSIFLLFSILANIAESNAKLLKFNKIQA